MQRQIPRSEIQHSAAVASIMHHRLERHVARPRTLLDDAPGQGYNKTSHDLTGRATMAFARECAPLQMSEQVACQI